MDRDRRTGSAPAPSFDELRVPSQNPSFPATLLSLLLKQDARALPDDFHPLEVTRTREYGRFHPEVSEGQPTTDPCSNQFVSKTGHQFGEAE